MTSSNGRSTANRPWWQEQDGVAVTVLAFNCCSSQIQRMSAVHKPEKLRPWSASDAAPIGASGLVRIDCARLGPFFRCNSQGLPAVSVPSSGLLLSAHLPSGSVEPLAVETS